MVSDRKFTLSFQGMAIAKLNKMVILLSMDTPQNATRKAPDITYLTQDETKRLFSVIKDRRDLAIFKTAYRHGLRASELGLLQHTIDLDLKQGRINIHRLKDSLSGTYPMQPDLIKVIRSYLRTREDESPYLFISNQIVPIDRTTLWRTMQKYAQLAKIPKEKRKFHILRHSIAIHLLDAGADIYFVKDWLGHKNIQNTMIYVRYTTATRDSKAREIFSSHRVI